MYKHKNRDCGRLSCLDGAKGSLSRHTTAEPSLMASARKNKNKKTSNKSEIYEDSCQISLILCIVFYDFILSLSLSLLSFGCLVLFCACFGWFSNLDRTSPRRSWLRLPEAAWQSACVSGLWPLVWRGGWPGRHRPSLTKTTTNASSFSSWTECCLTWRGWRAGRTCCCCRRLDRGGGGGGGGVEARPPSQNSPLLSRCLQQRWVYFSFGKCFLEGQIKRRIFDPDLGDELKCCKFNCIFTRTHS